MRSTFRRVLILAVVMLIASTAAFAQAERIDLKLRLKEGQVFRIRTTSQNSGVAAVGSKTESGSETMTAGMSFAVQSIDAEGKATLRVTFDTMEYSGGSTVGNDLLAQLNAAVTATMSALRGRPFTVEVSSRGEVGEMAGVSDAVDGALAGLSGQPESVRRLAELFVRQSMSEPNLRDGLRAIFSVLPGGPVEIGERWSRQVAVVTPNLTKTGAVYSKILSRANGVVKIKTYEQVSSLEMKSPFGVSMSMSGVQEGMLEVEEATGLLMSGSLAGNLKGTATGSNSEKAPGSLTSKSTLARY